MPLPPETQLAHRFEVRHLYKSLCHRPLPALALLVVAGCAAGLAWPAHGSRSYPSLDAGLALLAASFVIGLAFTLVRHDSRNRTAPLLAGALVLLVSCAGLAARRQLPPSGDISQLVREIPVPLGPQQPANVTLRGWVAASPQYGDFNAHFPLAIDTVTPVGQVTAKLSGRVWCSVPVTVTTGVGDYIELRAGLTDLPRPANPGQRDTRTSTLEAGCWCLAGVRQPGDVRVLSRTERYALMRKVAAIGAALPALYEANFLRSGRPYSRSTAQLLAAMTFGQEALPEPLPDSTREAFRAAGLSHLIVASGEQIALLAGLVIGGARLFGARRGTLILLVLPVLVFYALVAGNGASIWRAVIAGVCVAWALGVGRDVDSLSLWSLALIALLLLDPLQLHDIGLQLTFAATWGLLVCAPALAKRMGGRRRPGPLVEAASLTLAAQLATLPLLLYHFGRISLAGLCANALALPLAGMLVAGGLCGLVLAPVNSFNYLVTTCITRIASFTAGVAGGNTLSLPINFGPAVTLYLLLLAAIAPPDWWADWRAMLGGEFRQARRRLAESMLVRKTWRSWVAGAVMLALCGTLYQSVTWRTPTVRVTVLDVGQGEAIVIQGPTGRIATIDGGTSNDEGRGDVGRGVIVPYLQSIGASHIDTMFVTHADSDHCNGLPAVLHELPVGMAVDGAAAVTGKSYAAEPDYLALRDQWQRRGIPVVAAAAGQHFDLGGGASLTMLAPAAPYFDDDNNNCEVMRLDYGATSFLFTGDIEAPAEERLLQSGTHLQCTVLKVAHHGSGGSSSAEFLAAAEPKIALISCGRYNAFGHPSPQTLERLAARGVGTYRTDRDGATQISCDGHACWAQPTR